MVLYFEKGCKNSKKDRVSLIKGSYSAGFNFLKKDYLTVFSVEKTFLSHSIL